MKFRLKLGTTLQFLTMLAGFIQFGMSIWKHNINWFALATAFYAFAFFLEYLMKD